MINLVKNGHGYRLPPVHGHLMKTCQPRTLVNYLKKNLCHQNVVPMWVEQYLILVGIHLGISTKETILFCVNNAFICTYRHVCTCTRNVHCTASKKGSASSDVENCLAIFFSQIQIALAKFFYIHQNNSKCSCILHAFQQK